MTFIDYLHNYTEKMCLEKINTSIASSICTLLISGFNYLIHKLANAHNIDICGITKVKISN